MPLRTRLAAGKTAVLARQTRPYAGFGCLLGFRAADGLIAVFIDDDPGSGFAFGVAVVFLKLDAIRHTLLHVRFTELYPIADFYNASAIPRMTFVLRKKKILGNKYDFSGAGRA